jgi:hypothetical protein
MQSCGLEYSFYAGRLRDFDEILPWGHIDTGVSQDYLMCENRLIREALPTGDCRTQDCNACGLQRSISVCSNRLRRVDSRRV